MKKLRSIFSKNVLLTLFAVVAMSIAFTSCTNDDDTPVTPPSQHGHHGGGGGSN